MSPVTRRTILGLFPIALLAHWASPAHAQSVTAETAPKFFRVESQPGMDGKGRPIVWGYVYLHSKGQGSARVRLLLETLDAGRSSTWTARCLSTTAPTSRCGPARSARPTA